MASAASVAAPGSACTRRMRMKASPAYFALIDAVGGETADLNQRVYLGTISLVLPGSAAAPAYRDLGTVRKEALITIIASCM